MTKKEIQNASVHAINILARIHKELDCSIYNSETKQLEHYGLSEELEKIIVRAIQEELKNIK